MIRKDEPPGQLLPSGGLVGRMIIPARLFCKNMIINLSAYDHYLSLPALQKDEVKQKTISNVFRMWKQDTPDDVQRIVSLDISGGFDASLFMKDPYDV